jgi:hypothetical protein
MVAALYAMAGVLSACHPAAVSYQEVGPVRRSDAVSREDRHVRSRPDPILVINPRTDADFVDLVLTDLKGLGSDPTPELLEVALRRRYPGAVVRPRDLSHEPTVIWYVFRDGRWTPGDQDHST